MTDNWVSADHCDPLAPVAHQLRVPGIPGYGSWVDPGSPRRGVLVSFSGLQVLPLSSLAGGGQSVTPPIASLGDVTSGFGPSYSGTLIANLINDGWVLYNAPYPEMGWTGSGVPTAPALGLVDDVTNDPAFGARYLTTCMDMFDHIAAWARDEWGAGIPLVPIGGSHGGWMALQVAANRPLEIAGAMGHIPATIWSNVGNTWTSPADFNVIDTSGMDILPSAFNAIPSTLPVLVSYGTSDSAVAWGGTTVASSQSPVAASSLTGSTTLALTSTAKLTLQFLGTWGPCIKIATSGGYGFAIVQFTGISGNNITGCTTLFGSGTIEPGASAVQSNADALITTAQGLGKNVTRNQTTDNHGFYLPDAGQYYPATGPTQLSALGGVLPLNDVVDGPAFVSPHVSVKDTAGGWHTVTFTGTGTTTVGGRPVGTLTGCTFSGDNSKSIAFGSPIVASGDGTTSPMSLLWFLSQQIDPSCPAIH